LFDVKVQDLPPISAIRKSGNKMTTKTTPYEWNRFKPAVALVAFPKTGYVSQKRSGSHNKEDVIMSKAEIDSGICGFVTTVEASMEGKVCHLVITSDCKAIQQLAEELTHVNPLQEISSRQATPRVLQMGLKHCIHAACPVPVGIIKAVEVEARLALPKDVVIRLSKTSDCAKAEA
jgi:hypothetical protein